MGRPRKINLENTQIVTEPIKAEQVEETNTTEYLKRKIEQLEKQLSQKTEILNNTVPAGNLISKQRINTNDYITIVHLLDNDKGLTTHLEIGDRVIDFRKFGELSYLKFDEFSGFVSKYRDWFENNIIGLTMEDEDIAEKYNLIVNDNLPINSAILEKLQTLSEKELETLYNNLTQTHKDLIIRKWAMGYYEDDGNGKHPKNPTFANKKRIMFLNELSGGKMEKILEEVKFREGLTKGGIKKIE